MQGSYHMSCSRQKTVPTEETKMITNFCNIARKCPNRKSTVFMYGQKQPVKFLEKSYTVLSAI